MNDTTEPNQESNTSEQHVPTTTEIKPTEAPADIQPATVPVKENRPEMTTPVASVEAPQVKYLGYTIAEIRGLLLKGLMWCLIAAAAVAVVAILVGGMGDIAGRAVGTLFIAMLHIGVLFLLFPANHTNISSRKSVNMLINSLLVIVACSFFTAVAHAWDLIDWSIAWKLYSSYVLVFISLCHAKALMDLKENDPTVRSIVAINDSVITFVAAMIIVMIFIPEVNLLPAFYWRLLGALVVVDVTLSIVAIVRHRMFLQLHPELLEKNSESAKSGAGRIALIIVGVIVAFWVLASIAVKWL